MRVLIGYGTTEGHTGDLCRYAAQRLENVGHRPTLFEARLDDAGLDPESFDATILAASLHVGRYQAALVEFARARHEALNAGRSAFISVSLSAAGQNPDDWEGLQTCLARFEHETQWTPRAVYQAAGAIRYSQYDFFKRLALKFIAAQRGQRTVTSRDYDLTDYEALGRFVTGFVEGRAEGVR